MDYVSSLEATCKLIPGLLLLLPEKSIEAHTGNLDYLHAMFIDEIYYIAGL